MWKSLSLKFPSTSISFSELIQRDKVYFPSDLGSGHFPLTWMMWFTRQCCWYPRFINPLMHKAKLEYGGFGLSVWEASEKEIKITLHLQEEWLWEKSCTVYSMLVHFQKSDGKLVKSSCRCSQEVLTWVFHIRFWWIKSNDLYLIFWKCSRASSSSSHLGIDLELKASKCNSWFCCWIVKCLCLCYKVLGFRNRIKHQRITTMVTISEH